MNPDCTNMCTLAPDRRGPSDYFCSKSCRQTHWRRRKKLLADQQTVVEQLNDPQRSSAERVAIRQRLSHLEWILARYPDISHPSKTRRRTM